MIENLFAKNLKNLRTAVNLSQQGMANAIGISTNGYCNYENGKRMPTVDILVRLIQEFNIDATAFLTEEDHIFFTPKNTLEKRYNAQILKNFEKCCDRIIEIQEKNNLSNADMAKIMEITERRYLNISTGKEHPELKEINHLKEHFDVDIDKLLYGITSQEIQQYKTSVQQNCLGFTPEEILKLKNLIKDI